MFMASKVCFSYVFKKNRSSPTTSLNTKEWCKRLTIGPAGRFSAPQLCLAAARMNLRLAPPRRNTRTNVRFDGCPSSHESSKYVFISAMSRIKTVLFHLPAHLLALCFLLGTRLHRVPVPVTVKESDIVTSSCMWLSNACSARSLSLFSGLVLAVLTTRLTDSAISKKRTGCRDIW